MRPLKIGISWVRGVVGETLTPELLVDFACAFGTFVDGSTVAVGYDSRRSSPMVHAAVLAGLQSCGCTSRRPGLAPTPLVQFAIRSCRLAGGISITASHNDAKWNALKFIGKEGMLLNSFQSQEVMDIYHLGEFRKNPWNSLGKVRALPDIPERYFEYLLARLDVPSIRKARLKMVSDCCDGAGAGLIPAFLERLGCKVIRLNDEPDGEFPHPPEPNVRNMKGVASVVESVEADLGISVNADADRLGFVAAGGTALSEEYVFPIVADYLLESTRGPVVSTLSTSRMVENAAARHGRKVIYARIGEGYVVEKVHERKGCGRRGGKRRRCRSQVEPLVRRLLHSRNCAAVHGSNRIDAGRTRRASSSLPPFEGSAAQSIRKNLSGAGSLSPALPGKLPESRGWRQGGLARCLAARSSQQYRTARSYHRRG